MLFKHREGCAPTTASVKPVFHFPVTSRSSSCTDDWENGEMEFISAWDLLDRMAGIITDWNGVMIYDSHVHICIHMA